MKNRKLQPDPAILVGPCGRPDCAEECMMAWECGRLCPEAQGDGPHICASGLHSWPSPDIAEQCCSADWELVQIIVRVGVILTSFRRRREEDAA